MMKFNKGAITHIACSIPNKKIDLLNLAAEINLSEEEAKKIIKTTGFKKVNYCDNQTTTKDLCVDSAKNIISNITEEERNSIDALIFVSQTRDYILPQTSNKIQDELKLRNDILCLDIPLGCSGYLNGLIISKSLINSGLRSILLLSGDANSKIISKYDKTVSMVFGDAGSATLIKNISSNSIYDYGNDGSGYDSIIIKSTNQNNLNSDTENKLFMDGMDVMNFAIKRVPISIKNILEKSDSQLIDKYYFHQANEFMIRYLTKKLKIENTKVPFLAQDYGNTGPATIPLCICEDFKYNKPKLSLLCGFGVGLSWATGIIDTNNIIYTNIKHYEK